MRILSRHFLRGYLGFFGLIFSVSLVVMIVVEMLVNFDEVVDHRDAAGGALAYLLIRVPALYLREIFPIASFLAAFLCLGLAARSREIAALKTGGIAPQRVVVPLLAAAAVLAGVNLAVNETLLLGVTREFTHLERPNEPIVFRRGSFWYHRGQSFYNVRESDQETRTLRGVRIFELDPQGRLRASTHAEEVHVEDGGRWRLVEAVRQRFDPASPESPPVVEPLAEAVIHVASDRDLALLDASEEALSLRELRDLIALRVAEGRDTRPQRAQLSARLAEPAAVWLFALLAVPIGLGVERTRSMAVSALQGAAVIAAFRALWHVAELLGQAGFAAAVLAPWVVLGAFGLLGLGLFARAPR